MRIFARSIKIEHQVNLKYKNDSLELTAYVEDPGLAVQSLWKLLEFLFLVLLSGFLPCLT